MKRVALSLILLAAIAGTVPLFARGPGGPGGRGPAPSSTLTQARLSPHDVVSAHVGGQQGPLVAIYYGRPYSKDPRSGAMRTVWGTLVPWDKVWRLGADEGTTLISQSDLVFGDFTLPAGAYTLEMLPSKDGTSKLIINKAIGYWGIPYTAIASQELKQLDLKKEPDLDTPVDQLVLTMANANGGLTLKITWEKSVYSISFTAKK